jgi:hypothetical protein
MLAEKSGRGQAVHRQSTCYSYCRWVVSSLLDLHTAKQGFQIYTIICDWGRQIKTIFSFWRYNSTPRYRGIGYRTITRHWADSIPQPQREDIIHISWFFKLRGDAKHVMVLQKSQMLYETYGGYHTYLYLRHIGEGDCHTPQV